MQVLIHYALQIMAMLACRYKWARRIQKHSILELVLFMAAYNEDAWELATCFRNNSNYTTTKGLVQNMDHGPPPPLIWNPFWTLF